MSAARIKTVENWSESRLIIKFGDLGYQVPYFARNIRVSAVSTLLESKFELATQKIFTIPRINGEWVRSTNKPRLNIAPIWGWITQIQAR